MRKRTLFISLFLLLAAWAAAFLTVFFQECQLPQDAVAVNEVLQTVQDGWEDLAGGRAGGEAGSGEAGRTGADGEGGDDGGAGTKESGGPFVPTENAAGPDYVVLSADGTVLYRTGSDLSESIHEAVRHRDTVLDVEASGRTVGKLIIYNDSQKLRQEERGRTMVLLAAALSVSCALCAGYFCYLYRRVVKPFRKLEDFAVRVAGGNLDIPLEMDRDNLFGAFTESFDLMRSELKRARLAEAKASREKKELTAQLSHDIRTPVASIKAAAGVGAALAARGASEGKLFGQGAAGETENRAAGGERDNGENQGCGTYREGGAARLRENYLQIVRKADQIDALVTNLFTSTLEELHELPVTPVDMESGELRDILENADYLHRAETCAIPDCLLRADRLRLQQVFDNLFANSYKYAGTEIRAEARLEPGALVVAIEDLGGGVSEEELPFLKEKFKRGENAKDVSGAGLGLYISDYFMKEMGGELEVANGKRGLKVSVRIRMS